MPCLQEVGTPEPQRDGVTIRAIENEKIVPGEYDGDDARVERGERNQDVHGPSVVRAWASEFG